ncbi:glycosyltransferase family 9 protein, partial [Klebsiella pneumoniae]|uniref:glycosyltransferase family 9 protein n=1 Tax=Klebsiella pneumoniae TaxID=573 RepID=UPI00272E86C3
RSTMRKKKAPDSAYTLQDAFIHGHPHAVERTRELFAKSLGYAKPQTQGDYAIARHFLQHEASAAAPYLVFLHATTRDDKHWPETRDAGDVGRRP